MIAGGLLAALVALAAPQGPLVVSVGGPPDDPAYLPVHAAAALGTFDTEGVPVTLRRAKHPAGAIAALRDGDAQIAVTTSDQAVRGAWARGTPVRILTAHTQAPGVALVVSTRHRDRITAIEHLRGRRVGIPGPGTTGHLVLGALLASHRLAPADVELVSLGGAVSVTRLGGGYLTAAVLGEPWLGRAVAAGAGQVLVDLRSGEDAAQHLGGPFYDVVGVRRAKGTDKGPEPDFEGFVRALIRVQTWLAGTSPDEVADRLPIELYGDRDRFVASLAAAQRAYTPDGDATEAGLAATLRVLRFGSPWPATLKLAPPDLRDPVPMTAARSRLGPTPAPP